MLNNIILLFGGESQERFVSVASAQNLSRFLPADALCWFWAPNDAVYEVSGEFLRAHKDPFNSAFEPPNPPLFKHLGEALDQPAYREFIFLLGVHGGQGEDGTLQKWLETRGLCFTGSGSDACKKAFDKGISKRIVADFGLKTTPTLILTWAEGGAEQKLQALYAKHHKVVVKPLCDGSSVGLCIVDNDRALSTALELLKAEAHRPYIAEPFVAGVELTVGVVDMQDGPRALPCTEIRAQSGRVFDYNGKYLGEGVQEITPAEVAPELCKKAQEAALVAHKALGLRGYSRTDLIMSDGEPIYLETNTLPGLTRASLVPQQLAADGTTMAAFIERILSLARNTHEQKSL